MEKSSKLGKDILETLGFEILNNGEELATGETKTADFLVKLENENFLVEVKLKEADDDENKSREEKLSNGEVYISNGYNHTNSMLTTIMRSANRQIRSSLENMRPLQKSPSPNSRNQNKDFQLFSSQITPDSTQIPP